MANKRRGQLTVTGEWARHLRPALRRAFWKAERQAGKRIVRAEGRAKLAAGAPGGPSPESVVREFWRLMASNDFFSVGAVLAEDFVMEWPQSKERIRGAENFARMNAEYPTAGRWEFRINRLVASGETVVTQVSVTDGPQSAEPISFFTVAHGKVTRLVEYWPEPFAPAENRRRLTESMA